MSNPPKQVKHKQVKVGALIYAQLIKHMFDGVHSCQELAEITGLHYVTVLQYTRELYAAGAAHIASWDKDDRGRDMIRIYKLGPGRDAKRQAMTKAERSQRHRAKKAHQELMHRLAAPTEPVTQGESS